MICYFLFFYRPETSSAGRTDTRDNLNGEQSISIYQSYVQDS